MIKNKSDNLRIKNKETNPIINTKYIDYSSNIITEALGNGSDVMQLSNGDIIITEYKATTSYFKWDNTKKKLIKQTKSHA